MDKKNYQNNTRDEVCRIINTSLLKTSQLKGISDEELYKKFLCKVWSEFEIDSDEFVLIDEVLRRWKKTWKDKS